MSNASSKLSSGHTAVSSDLNDTTRRSQEAALIQSRARLAIAKVVEVSPDSLADENGIANPWDSLRHLNVILAVEEACGIRFPLDRIPELTDVDRIMKEIEGFAKA